MCNIIAAGNLTYGVPYDFGFASQTLTPDAGLRETCVLGGLPNVPSTSLESTTPPTALYILGDKGALSIYDLKNLSHVAGSIPSPLPGIINYNGAIIGKDSSIALTDNTLAKKTAIAQYQDSSGNPFYRIQKLPRQESPMLNNWMSRFLPGFGTNGLGSFGIVKYDYSQQLNGVIYNKDFYIEPKDGPNDGQPKSPFQEISQPDSTIPINGGSEPTQTKRASEIGYFLFHTTTDGHIRADQIYDKDTSSTLRANNNPNPINGVYESLARIGWVQIGATATGEQLSTSSALGSEKLIGTRGDINLNLAPHRLYIPGFKYDSIGIVGLSLGYGAWRKDDATLPTQTIEQLLQKTSPLAYESYASLHYDIFGRIFGSHISVQEGEFDYERSLDKQKEKAKLSGYTVNLNWTFDKILGTDNGKFRFDLTNNAAGISNTHTFKADSILRGTLITPNYNWFQPFIYGRTSSEGRTLFGATNIYQHSVGGGACVAGYTSREAYEGDTACLTVERGRYDDGSTTASLGLNGMVHFGPYVSVSFGLNDTQRLIAGANNNATLQIGSTNDRAYNQGSIISDIINGGTVTKIDDKQLKAGITIKY